MTLATYSLTPDIFLYHADCRDALAALPDNSIDSVVTDPPYGLQFMGKEWDKLWRDKTDADVAWRDAHEGSLAARARKLPDYSTMQRGEQMQQTHLEWAREAFRVLKPGGHIAAFSASRTYHRMACAIEDAGFEMRDSLMWLYATGFPKSHSMRDIGHPELGTALKPAFEPIVLARKPLSEGTVAANVLRWRTGAINVDACRVGLAEGETPYSYPNGAGGNTFSIAKGVDGTRTEPVKGNDAGRWPANVVHDGSDEVVGRFPNTKSGALNAGHKQGAGMFGKVGGDKIARDYGGDSGSAARFFYSAKASAKDRAGSKHPTVKPINLIAWLARLITPPGGVVLDPFSGSGTTGAAAAAEGFRAVLIEREAEYVADIRARFVTKAAA